MTTSVHGHPSPPANSVPQSPLLASNDGSDDCSSKLSDCLSLTSSLVAKLEVISLVLFCCTVSMSDTAATLPVVSGVRKSRGNFVTYLYCVFILYLLQS